MNRINIRPQVSILGMLKHLEYKTWYALAEFVDNSIASYQANKAALQKLHGEDFQLEVRIEIDDVERKITVRDNAAGIDESNYERAFRAAEIPVDRTGLSEFGMGMKSAACWFSDHWTVRTTAMGEAAERSIRFDMAKISEDRIEELEFESQPAKENQHYTVLELYGVNRIPRRKGLGKVKSHLADIYRTFLRSGDLILKVNGLELKYSEPAILKAPFHTKPNQPEGPEIKWRHPIDFTIGGNRRVTGFVAIRKKGSTAEAGFALFRRGRVIEGSFDEGFRPVEIFGSANSYSYQRVFGELHLEGFEVSFTKKGIQWDEDLDEFLRILKSTINSKEFPLLQQAENYRVRATEGEYKQAGKVLDKTTSELEQKAGAAMQAAAEKPQLDPETEETIEPVQKAITRQFRALFNDAQWLISIELSYDPSVDQFMEVGKHLAPANNNLLDAEHFGIRLSLTHPFMVAHVGADAGKLEPVLKLVAAMGLSEMVARSSGSSSPGEIRRNLNALITEITAHN